MYCGRQLTRYTYDVHEGAVFCTQCFDVSRLGCEAVLAILPGYEWAGIVKAVAGTLWLSPDDPALWFCGIGRLSYYLNALAKDDPDAAAENLRSDAYITIAKSRANQREW
jgi:hypothetical protein